MFYAAAQALAGTVSQAELEAGLLYPAVDRLRDVSSVVAAAVMREVVRAGLGDDLDAAAIRARLETGTWSPVYRAYRAAD